MASINPRLKALLRQSMNMESEHLATKADLARLENKLDTGLAQLQIKLMTWTTVPAGIIIAVLKLT